MAYMQSTKSKHGTLCYYVSYLTKLTGYELTADPSAGICASKLRFESRSTQ